jgi:hypothetical protein
MKILYVIDKGCNVSYLTKTLEVLSSTYNVPVVTATVAKYLNIDQDQFDVLIYQTFPAMGSPKFPRQIAKVTDKKFYSFKKLKILFDANDSSGSDGFSRFKDKTTPRIKNAPNKSFLQDYNIILETTFPVKVMTPVLVKRTVPISYVVSTDIYHHKIREDTKRILESYKVKTDMTWKKGYRTYLNSVLISVAVPGYGEVTFRHLESLNAGCLLLSHECLNEIKLLPHADLVDGQDYVSFNLQNLTEKLDYLFGNLELLEKIRKSGQQKFFEGFSYHKSAKKLLGELSCRSQNT